MNLLIVTQYFWPENFIVNDLVCMLKEQGHKVKVLTGKPNYPEGQIYQGYTPENVQLEQFAEGIDVFRVPLRPRGKAGAKNLILNYLSFVFNGLRYFPKAVKDESYDAIIVFAVSPLTAAIPAILLKWKLKTHLAIWVQDLWPESLKATGFVKNSLFLKLASFLVRLIYRASDTLLIQSQAFKSAMLKYTDENKIVYYPNSYKYSDLNTSALPQALQNELTSYFSVVFAGNLGTAQSLPTVLDAIESLKSDSDIRFVFLGYGSLFEWLSEQKELRQLNNLVLAGRFPATVMPEVFKKAGALLVSLNKEEIFSLTIPSKIQAYLASGKPILASLDGEGARIVEEARAGFATPAGDSKKLAECIKKLYKMGPEERANMGYNGREYFLKNFDMSTLATRLVQLLEERSLMTQ